MFKFTRRGLLPTLACAGLLAIVSAQSLGLPAHYGIPSLASPMAVPLVLATYLGIPPILVVLLPGLALCLWLPGLLAESAAFPRRTWIAAMIVGAASILSFVFGWRFAMKYQGGVFAIVGALGSAVLGAACYYTMERAKREPSFMANLAAHGILALWIVTYAFPYFGPVE